MKFNFFIFFLIFGILLFSGCGQEELKTCPSDTTYIKYTLDTQTNTCMKKEIEKNKCGNGIAEPISNGENVCNCPNDIKDKTLPFEDGGCSGNKGKYLEYYCNSKNTCDTKINGNVKKELPKELNLKDGNNFDFETQVEFYSPIIINQHKVKVNFMLKNFINNDITKISNINIRKVYLTSSKGILGQKVINKNFKTKFDEYSVEIPFGDFTFDSFSETYNSVGIKLLVTYNKMTYDSNGELTKTESITTEPSGIFVNNLILIDPKKPFKEIKKEVVAPTWG